MLLICISSCKKKDSSSPISPASDPCKGNNLCFMLDGTQKSQNGKWVVITGPKNRNRIAWEEGSGASYKNIELDIYGDSIGTYIVSSSPTAGQAGFQYYEAGGPVNVKGISGTVVLTKNDGSTLTGTFTMKGIDGSKSHDITDGNFFKVPK